MLLQQGRLKSAGRGYTARIVTLIVFGACCGLASTTAQAQVRAQGQAPTAAETIASSYTSQLLPPSREEIADQERLSWTLKKFPPQPYMSEIYWNYPQDTPAFFRDALMQLVVRSYSLSRDNSDNSKTNSWAGGGWLAFRSGLIADHFGVHAAYYTSQRLSGPLNEDGAKLLAPGQNSLGMLGQLYGRIQIIDQEVRAGRQLVDTPLINAQDNRMVPNTFDGVTLVSLPDKERNYDYSAGYLWDVKQRDSNDFISMSDALAGKDVKQTRGAPFAMVKYRPFAGFSTVVSDYYVEDFVNTGFAQMEYDFRQPKNVPNWILGVNVIDQRSVGSTLLATPGFQTYQVSAKVQMAYAGWTFFVAGSATGDDSKIYSPFGSKPNYTDMQQASFDNAREKAFGGSIAYDLGHAFTVLSGLSVGSWYSQGWDAINPTTQLAIADRSELDVWLQYRPTEGPFKGFRLKVQYSDVWQDGNRRIDQPEFRAIVDYTILVRPPT